MSMKSTIMNLLRLIHFGDQICLPFTKIPSIYASFFFKKRYCYTIMEKKEIQAKQYGVLRKAVFFVIIYKILIIATKSSSIFCRQPLN